ncbi:MAG: DegT/DnrJ/EryC1/StrS family aminotransferase [Casimicrobiaceae bacterium]|nr:DegT/DnrJ/EryC1/StrS family aminotransferase [Casimicrobiaceae bacterium]
MIPISRPFIGPEERALVEAVLDSGHLVQGPRVAELETLFREKTGAKHAIAVCNGTAALHTALLAHGIGPGDEVITTPFTFMASVHAILFVGATPRFVDILPCCFNLDPRQLEAAITPRTKAILPVHLYGFPADLPAIRAVADRHGLTVIQDAAQAVGATVAGEPLGRFGTACYSLYATKNVHSAEGGMVTTNDDQLAERCRLIRAHGSPRRYYHDTLGYNFRLSDLHAALAIPQMRRLEAIIAQRRANAEWLNAHIVNPRVITPRLAGCCARSSLACQALGHVWHQYVVRIPEGRDEAVEKLTALGIGTAVFYPVPAHRQKHILERGLGEVQLPMAEQAAREVLALPVHTGLTEAELETIARAVNAL